MSFEVIVTPSARADVFEIYAWLLENKSRSISDEWLWSFSEASASLSKFPRRCPVSPESAAFDVEIRERIFGSRRNNYRILFSIQNEKVFVLRVRSTKQRRMIDDADPEDRS